MNPIGEFEYIIKAKREFIYAILYLNNTLREV